MERYRDPLAEMTDEDVRQPQVELPLYPTVGPTENPANRFRYDDYEWEGFKVEGQVTLKLTRGYFTFVGEDDIEKIDGRSVCAHVDPDQYTREIRQVRAVLTVNGRTTYLHRFLMSARKRDLVDHVNNLPLDNRSIKNLWVVNHSLNNSNRFYDTELKRGVKREGQRYRGQIWFEGKGYFSKVVDTEAEAHAWYLAKHAEFYGKALHSIEKPARSLPVFPPRKVVYEFADTF